MATEEKTEIEVLTEQAACGRRRHWVYTLHDWTPEEEQAICAAVGEGKLMRYMCYGREVTSTGRPHLQGYCQTFDKQRLSGLKKVFPTRTYFAEAKAGLEANQRYTRKEGDWISLGKAVKARARTDIADFLADAEDLDLLSLSRRHPTQFAKYHKAAQMVSRLGKEAKRKKKLAKKMADAELRDWQADAVRRLEEQDDRKVLWYVDHMGGRGKTFLAKYLIATKGAFLLQGGRTADINCAYQGEEYVVCDFTREKQDIINYSCIESLKNGLVFNSKYHSGLKLRSDGCKIIAFSNWEPDRSKLSADRWEVIPLDPPPLIRHNARVGKFQRFMERDARNLSESFDFE